ncbi:S41 family peptidase [Thalassoglobus sp. JC818]|uniref:S41 family peptidase n=1 Tax=Thalassoglobus sp. JC818 TaxID=3232136 RepID=UPI0034575782
MSHSIKNNLTSTFVATLAFLVLLGGGFAHSEMAIQHVEKSRPTFFSHTNELNSVARTESRFDISHDDRGMPLAREDVAPIRTAVVPGRGQSSPTLPSYTPTTPGYSNPVQPQFPSQPQYIVPGTGAPSSPINIPTQNPSTPQTPDQKQTEITSRFSDPKMLGFLSNASMQQLTSLYHEVSRMIDARHVNPVSYEVRVASSVEYLVAALSNPTFLRATGASANQNTIRQTQSELLQITRSQPARSATEAVGVMQWTAELVNRQLGIRREAVALEFINGTIDSLDQYSAFMPLASAYAPGATTDPIRTVSLEENIVGIGVELETHPRGAILVGVVDNSPASELGLQEGDIIVAVNRQSTNGLDLNAVAGKLGGSIGTVITLDIDRNGQLYRGNVTRRSIYVSSVTGTKMIDTQNKVGYVRLKQFSASSRKDLEAALWSLHNQGMKSLVMDLRGNPGGLLDQAIEVSNLFVPCGTIVSTKGRNVSDNSQEQATYQQTWNTPVVVLVDKNSASASEIFAAAIQENGRGVIVGRQSYGKGTVQTHFPLETVSAQLKLTTAKFYSPKGREMAGAGVTPDVYVPESTSTGTAGTNRDSDINAALAQISQGIPFQMAQQAASCRNGSPQVNLQTVPSTTPSINTLPLQLNLSSN